MRLSIDALSRLILLALLLTLPASGLSATAYRIDSAASDIHWRVYRSDTLAARGHNHVIAASRISGSVELAQPPHASRFKLEIPVAALVIDAPALRRRYSEDFSKPISTDAIIATRSNMLGPKLLDGVRYPRIQLRGEATLRGNKGSENITIPCTLLLAGKSIQLRLPTRISITNGLLRASGSFTLSHRQLGLKPFSAALGALQVAENIDFNFVIVARQ